MKFFVEVGEYEVGGRTLDIEADDLKGAIDKGNKWLEDNPGPMTVGNRIVENQHVVQVLVPDDTVGVGRRIIWDYMNGELK